MFFSNIPFKPNVTCLHISMCRAITIGSFAITGGFWPAVKTFKGPCFGCDCGIKCCQLLLKRLGP